MKKIHPLLLLFILVSGISNAQNNEIAGLQRKDQDSNEAPNQLFNEIAKQDSLVFEAFNTCDTVSYRQHFRDDLEFYHDLGGLTVGIENEMKSIREMCNRGNSIRRALVPGSLQVYPLKGYGAVEIGVHRFYHKNKGQGEKLSGTYQFIHIWQFADGNWKITRIISYGHDNMNND